jgi:uncharacterized oxidoreductase
MNISGNTILITGGASGIGCALAEAFHQLGNTVIIAGRRRKLLDAVTAANPGMLAYELDVAGKQAITSFAARICREHPALNVLINNAGIMKAEDLSSDRGNLVDAEAMVATNLLGPIRLTAALISHLQSQPLATIVNVSSGLAFVPLAPTPTYSATKAAVHSYSQSLRHQLRKTAVEVIELIPPGVQTNLTPGQAENPDFLPLADFIAEVMMLFEQSPTPAEICVNRVLFLRKAEAEGGFDVAFAAINDATG